MKLNKKSKLLLTTSFVVTSLLGALVIVHTAVQILGGMRDAGEEYKNAIGIMDTNTFVNDDKGSVQLEPIIVVKGSDTEPQILAKPTEVLLYSEAEAFVMPNHWGFKAWKAMFYLRTLLLMTMVVMLLYFALVTLRGSRTGVLFTKSNLHIIYALAPISFLYLLANDNFYTFKQYAISELYADKASIALHGKFYMNAETLVVPLLLIVVAQLYKVAIMMNEEEVMTV